MDTVHILGDGTGDVHMQDRGLRLAEIGGERIQHAIYKDPTMAFKELYLYFQVINDGKVPKSPRGCTLFSTLPI